MNETLTITIDAATRKDALTLADARADLYFGDLTYWQHVVRAEVTAGTADGSVQLWRVSVDYVRFEESTR